MMGTCCPVGDSGLVLFGFAASAAAAAALRAFGMYGVYVVCGPAAGCRGGGRMGPERGGGIGGSMGLDGIGGVAGGERKDEVEDVGLADCDPEPFSGKRSG